MHNERCSQAARHAALSQVNDISSTGQRDEGVVSSGLVAVMLCQAGTAFLAGWWVRSLLTAMKGERSPGADGQFYAAFQAVS